MLSLRKEADVKKMEKELEQISKELIRLMIARENPSLADMVEKGKYVLQQYELKIGEITPADLDAVLAGFRATTREGDLERYRQWASDNKA